MAAKNIAVEVAPGFFNIRGTFKILAGLVDIGTHMSLIRLASGRFLCVDTIDPTPEVRSEIDRLTDGGKLIEAVVATHPFHTIYFPAFYTAYPSVPYYGCPRHLRTMPQIPWAGDVNTEEVRRKWEPEVEMRIPAGSEFVDPLPPKSNHFSNVFVFHKASRTIHNDDNVIVIENMPFFLKIFGFRDGAMYFHPSLKGPGLYPTPEAPMQYRCWVEKMMTDWDFDNICTAHTGNKIGGAKEALRETLQKYLPKLEKIAKRNAAKGDVKDVGSWSNDKNDRCECG